MAAQAEERTIGNHSGIAIITPLEILVFRNMVCHGCHMLFNVANRSLSPLLVVSNTELVGKSMYAMQG